MSKKDQFGRRDALKLTALGLAGAIGCSGKSDTWPLKPSGDSFGGLKIGLTSYTTRKLSLDDTIAALQRFEVKYISLKSVHLPLDSSKAERQKVGRKISDAGLELMGCGVLELKNDERQIRDTFDYCVDVGAPVAVSSPARDALGAIDKVIRDYDNLKVAIHNHGPEDESFPSPTGAYQAIQGLDERIGCCVDVGHTFRLAEDPVEALKIVSSRLYDVHMKDIKVTNEKPPMTWPYPLLPVGRGVIDHPSILRTLAELKFSYQVALEWEGEEDDPLPGMAESYGYMRGIMANERG